MPEYSKSVISFIDILGFGSIVREKSPGEIQILMQLAEENSKTGEGVAKATERRSIYFSDTIITSCPLNGPEGSIQNGILFHEIMDIVFLQADMINRGETFLRGAMTIGDIYHDENMVFGPGLIDAYEIESKLANFPRVVINPKLLLDYENNPDFRFIQNTPEEDYKYIRELIRQDSDGFWFIDYLRGMNGNFDAPNFYLDFLRTHRELILTKAKSNKKLNSISLKYNWLATYHNAVINEFFDSGFLSPDEGPNYLIEKDELETMHQFRLSANR